MRSASSIIRKPSMQNTLKRRLKYSTASLENGTHSSYRPAQETRQRYQGTERAKKIGQQAFVGEHRAREALGATEEAIAWLGIAGEEAGGG
jgi:hypothetical protein